MRLLCPGCGAEVPASQPHPLRCPGARAGDGVDHVLRRALAPSRAGFDGDPAEGPYVRFRERLSPYALARAGGLADAAYIDLVRGLDRAVAAVAGQPLRATPLLRSEALGQRLQLAPVWVKDETGSVAGSHKARHLFLVLIHLEVLDRLGRGQPRGTPLAIASCGNAALAAAVLARAAQRPLQVFIPPHAHPAIVDQLERLGAQVVRCPRVAGEPGDPCYHRFQEALRQGAIPFCCQGPDNGLAVEGGLTLGYELACALAESGAAVDHLFVQVGGGALASACAQGLAEAAEAGVLPRPPRLHAVQTAGAAPLARAYAGVARLVEAGAPVDAALQEGGRRRAAFMWPWEQEPRSIAEGILDDETYDWLQVVGGVLRSGGGPLVVSEEELRSANALGREATGIAASATGTAGLAGLLQAARGGRVSSGERAAVLFTGVQR